MEKRYFAVNLIIGIDDSKLKTSDQVKEFARILALDASQFVESNTTAWPGLTIERSSSHVFPADTQADDIPFVDEGDFSTYLDNLLTPSA